MLSNYIAANNNNGLKLSGGGRSPPMTQLKNAQLLREYPQITGLQQSIVNEEYLNNERVANEYKIKEQSFMLPQTYYDEAAEELNKQYGLSDIIQQQTSARTTTFSKL